MNLLFKGLHFKQIMGKRFSKSKRLTDADFDYLETTSYCKAQEIKALYREFLTWSPKGDLNKKHFCAMYRKLCPTRDPRRFVETVFRAFDTNNDGLITFNEFLFAISSSCFGTVEEKLEWVFKLVDLDGNGVIGKHELIKIVEQIYLLFGDDDGNIYGALRKKIAAIDRGKKIFEQLSKDDKRNITRDEFVSGMAKDEELTRLLTTNTLAFVQIKDKSPTDELSNSNNPPYTQNISY